MELTFLGQETQLGVLGTPSTSLYTWDIINTNTYWSPTAKPLRPQPVTTYRVWEHLHHLLRHTTSRYVTNLEYHVIANHLSASGLWLAPHLTHALSSHCDDREAGDNLSHVSHRSLSSYHGSHHPTLTSHIACLTSHFLLRLIASLYFILFYFCFDLFPVTPHQASFAPHLTSSTMPTFSCWTHPSVYIYS